MSNKERIYLNMYREYVPKLTEAISTGKWIIQGRQLIDPLTYLNVYSRSWMGLGYEMQIKDPHEAIREAEALQLNDDQQKRLNAFKERVANYEAMKVEPLLLQTIKENRYPPGFDQDYGHI